MTRDTSATDCPLPEDLEPGAWVRDRSPTGSDSRGLVLAVHEARADEWFEPAIDSLLASWGANRQYPDDDPVVEVAFYDDVDAAFPTDWTVGEVLATYDDAASEVDTVRTYAYPASRLTVDRAPEAD